MHFGTQQIGKRLEMMTYRCEEFMEEIRRALGGKEELRDDWTTTVKVVRGHSKTGTRCVIKPEERRQGDLVVG